MLLLIIYLFDCNDSNLDLQKQQECTLKGLL